MKNKTQIALIIGIVVIAFVMTIVPKAFIEDVDADVIADDLENGRISPTCCGSDKNREQRMTKEDWRVQTILLVENTDLSKCNPDEIEKLEEVQEDYIGRLEKAPTSDRIDHIYYQYKETIKDISDGKAIAPKNDFGCECHMKKR